MSKRERVEELQALSRLMADPAGRRWIRQFLTNCHIWDTSFSSEAMRMAFLEGERNQGLFVMAEIGEANPDMFLQMLKDNVNERSSKSDSDDSDGSGFDSSTAEPGADSSA